MDKHLATHMPIMFWHFFLMLNKYTSTMEFSPLVTDVAGTECSMSLCLVGRWHEYSKRKWDENPAQMWAGILLKASARLDVLKDIWGLYKGFKNSLWVFTSELQ